MSRIDIKAWSAIAGFFQDSSDKMVALAKPDTKVKTLCIAGVRQQDIDAVEDILAQAGMAKAISAKREDRMDLAFWHAQVTGDDDAIRHAINNPGKLWEHMAAEIFLANAPSRLWGWADVRSTWLLDYWQQFEPHMAFVLVCTPLSHMLAGALLSDGQAVDVRVLVEVWQAHHRELLQFHRKHPRLSVLMSSSLLPSRAQVLVQRCVDCWRLPLAVDELVPTPNRSALDPLALYLAEQLSDAYPQAQSLQQELSTAMGGPGAELWLASKPLPHRDIVAGYRQLRDRSAELALIQEAQEQHARLQKEVTGLKQEKTTAEARKSELEKQARREGLEKELAELKNARAALERDKVALTKARDEQTRLAADSAAKVEELNKVRQALESEKAALAKARDEQATLAVDRANRIEELDKARQVLESEKAASAKARDELVTLAANSRKKEDALEASDARRKATEQENELLLLQLHQVQEELEHYFLLGQKLEKQAERNEMRWARMLSRNPGYMDYESIELNQAKQGENQLLRWHFKNVTVAERVYPDLSFQTFVQNGVVGFVFTREDQGASPLMHWPAGSGRTKEVVLAPTGTPTNVAHRLEAFYDLSTSDWTFIKTLPLLLTSALDRQDALRAGAGFNPVPLRVALDKFCRVLERLPASLRWDSVKLQHEQVNQDEECLSIRLDRSSFGDRFCPEFEFRLACAAGRPDSFGQHPRLAFPEACAKALFQNWFDNSQKGVDARLELNMVLPGAMQLDVWQHLSEHDQRLLHVLTRRLPIILMALQNAGVRLQRAWGDWLDMAEQMQRSLTLGTRRLEDGRLQLPGLKGEPLDLASQVEVVSKLDVLTAAKADGTGAPPKEARKEKDIARKARPLPADLKTPTRSRSAAKRASASKVSRNHR